MSKRVSKTNKLGDKIKKEKVNKKDEELVLSDISEDEEIVIEVEKPKKNKNTKETGTQDINKYQKLDHVDQILTRSETYIGSTNNDEEQEIFILKSTSDIIVENENVFNGYKIIKKNINYSEGFIKIFAEVMCNAIDNVWNSIQNGVKTNFIKFYINKETNTFTIFNDGLNISTKNHPKENIPLPEMIFGVLLTSSNYNDNEERMTSGRNGYGIKLTNIFSTSFEVEIYNKEEGILYTQLWENNMKKKNSPILSKKGFPKSIEEGKNGYTKITWKPDMNRFNLKNISDDLFAVFEKFILDTAMAVGLLNNTKVMYNDKRIEIKDIQQYVNYYFEELPEEKIVISTENSKIFLFCINDPVQVSFVNGNYTKYGGTHVDAWCEAIFKPILEKLNKKLEKKKVSLSIKDIKKYFFIFIFCNIDKPEFDGQTKDKLTKPKKEEIKAIIKPSELNKILKWSFIEKINESLQVKEMLELKKTERKRGRVKVEGLDDANFSGKNGKSQDCILCLTEGSSARTYVVEGMKYGLFDKKGSDYIGVLPIRGKFLNAKNASISTLTNNKEVNSLIQSLGLQYNVDYTLQENFKKLRYGRLLACVDSDVDGSHITSLLYNFFHTLYPTLLNVKGFFSFMRTPIIKIIHKNSELVFYHYEQAKKYIQINQPKNIKYFKGLATSKNNDIKNDFGKCIVNIEKNEETDELMKNIFHKDFSDYRKEWLLNYKPKEYNNDTLDQKNFIIKNTIIEDINSSEFINNELILFSLDDCKRSIPNMCDGLKESQRKVLFAAFKKGLKYEKESIKVAQLSGFVSEHTNYHHGEDNLHETIIRLAQRYVGSNNIPLFYDDGQFGSRLENGKDAGNGRYIFTKCDLLTRYIFREEDENYIKNREEDGDIIEKEVYYPIIPTILLNGCSAGIGTGFSCSVPNYNLEDLITYIKNWLNGKENIKLLPNYKGFNGKIELQNNKIISYGVFEHIKNNVYKITEIPLGKNNYSITKYKEKLHDLEDKDVLKLMRYDLDSRLINFEISWNGENPPTYEDLFLVDTMHTSNMVLFNSENKLQKYNNIDEIMEDFCNTRFNFYKIRKDGIIKNIELEIPVLENKIKFINEILNNTIDLKNNEDCTLIHLLENKKYYKHENNYNYLLNINIRSMTKNKIKELENELNEKKNNLENYKKLTIKQIWTQELDELLKKYNEWDNTQINTLENKLKEKTKSKKGKN